MRQLAIIQQEQFVVSKHSSKAFRWRGVAAKDSSAIVMR